MHLCYEPRGAGVNLDPDKIHLLAEPDRVGGVAGQTVDALQQDKIESAALSIVH